MTSGAAAVRGTLDLDRESLVAWGTRFGRELVAPAIIALSGDLGAGKTTLTQAICAGYGVLDPVTSPTFALVHQYRGGPAMVFHLDLYRIGGPAELTNLGWDELIDSNAIILVEWPERAVGALPPSAQRLHLSHVADAPELRRLTW
jgi:tRNA threonylcarbamoyladenosine biosynthesis protein TsaE